MVPCLIEINPYLGEYHLEYKVHWVLKCPRIYSMNLSKIMLPPCKSYETISFGFELASAYKTLNQWS